MRRAQDGDGRAYETLLHEVAALVRAFLRRRVASPDSVEDIVQETLLSIHRARHTYDPARPFQPWMYAIARHRMLDHVRRVRRRSENEVLGETGLPDIGAETVAVETGLSGLVQRAMALLTNRQREVVHMLKLEGKSVAEIATKTGLSQSAVKVTAHRGYKLLRKLMVRPARDE